MAARNSTLARTNARSEVCDPAHEWEFKLPEHAQSKPKTRDATVKLIAQLMTAGEWRTGVTQDALVRAWGVPRSTVATHAAEASRIVRAAVNPDELRRVAGESVERLMRLGYQSEQSGETNSAIVAFTKAAELCLAMLKAPGDNSEPRQTEKEAFNRLRELGWTPPNTLLGLPPPNVMGPPLANERRVEPADDDED